MNKTVKQILKLLAAIIGVIGGLFTVYFFNLDMKFVAKFVDPILQKHYDSMTHNQYV